MTVTSFSIEPGQITGDGHEVAIGTATIDNHSNYVGPIPVCLTGGFTHPVCVPPSLPPVGSFACGCTAPQGATFVQFAFSNSVSVTTTITDTAAITYPYKAVYSSDFSMGDANHAKMVMDFYKMWEDGKVDDFKSVLAEIFFGDAFYFLHHNFLRAFRGRWTRGHGAINPLQNARRRCLAMVVKIIGIGRREITAHVFIFYIIYAFPLFGLTERSTASARKDIFIALIRGEYDEGFSQVISFAIASLEFARIEHLHQGFE